MEHVATTSMATLVLVYLATLEPTAKLVRETRTLKFVLYSVRPCQMRQLGGNQLKKEFFLSEMQENIGSTNKKLFIFRNDKYERVCVQDIKTV